MPSSATPLESYATPSISSSSCLPPASCPPHPRLFLSPMTNSINISLLSNLALQMPVLTSSAFLETQVVILSLPPPQHNFSKNTALSPPTPTLPAHPPTPLLLSPLSPLAVYALAQAASMTLHVSLLQRSPFLNDRAMTVSITISDPLPPRVSAPARNGFHTSSNRSTSTATSSSIPLTNHILTHIPTQVATLVFVLPAQNGSPLPTPINIIVPTPQLTPRCSVSHFQVPTSFSPTNALGQRDHHRNRCKQGLRT
ncbi:hypothetical protein M405DRAFT_870185 [Rhizopogon salebrosus TDB-379]|nr:hypothetical protein M405DRAFT_870185 [Rhizopogon salebrosus TDB-379]